MRSLTHTIYTAFGIAALATSVAAEGVVGPDKADELAARGTLNLLRERHLLKRELDNEMAGKALDAFVGRLDPRKLYFRQADIREFDRRKWSLTDRLKEGDLSLPFDVYRRFQRRTAEAAKLWEKLLGPGERYDFNGQDVYVTEKGRDHPETADDAARQWRLFFKWTLLHTKVTALSGSTNNYGLRSAQTKLLRSYRRLARDTTEVKGESVRALFLQSLVKQFDEESGYYSAAAIRDYKSSMAGTFVGVGVTIRDTYDGLTILEVFSGGPAEKGGLRSGDRIVSVGQGAAGEMVNIVPLTQSEALELISGKIGTSVRLGVVRKGKTNPELMTFERAVIRDPKARFEHSVRTVGPVKVGYIKLSKLYLSQDRSVSSTKDTRGKLEDFTKRGVDVVILDIRGNTGGYLSEAIGLPGLFIAKGDLLQTKDNSGSVNQSARSGDSPVWLKGVVLLTDRGTASGAEVLCAAIQDHKRGLVVGLERTNGSGTIGRFSDISAGLDRGESRAGLGALSYTSARFYRPGGDTVQGRGVRPDVVLPSGSPPRERVASPIGFSRVPAAALYDHGMLDASVLARVRVNSRDRVRASSAFRRLRDRAESLRRDRRRVTMPLNERLYRAARGRVLAGPSDNDADIHLNEAYTIAADYAFALGGKTAALKDADD